MARKTRIPSLNSVADIKEALDVQLGRRGDPLDRAVTLRDLLGSSRFFKVSPGRGGHSFEPRLGVPTPDPTEVFLPAPTEFLASPHVDGVALTWSQPQKHQSLLFTEVWRGVTAVFEDAVLLEQVHGYEHVDALEDPEQVDPSLDAEADPAPATVDPFVTEFFYWARFVSITGHAGAFSDPISSLSGKILPSAPTGLLAVPQAGGVFVIWDAPLVEDQVAFTTVYRGTTNTLEDAVSIGEARVNGLLDALKVDDETAYFYWARHTSVSEDEGPAAGPVTAAALEIIPEAPTGLTATSLFGGVNLTWDRALVPFDIAFTEVYRGTSNDPALRVFLTEEDGTMYFDKLDSANPVTYYYWVRFVSVTEDPGDFAGPVSAASLPLVDDILQELTDQLNESQFTLALNDRIDKIEVNETAITNEQTVRSDADGALASDITTVSAVANAAGKIFRQPSTPTTGTEGDLWFDTDDGDKLYRHNGTTWVLTDLSTVNLTSAVVQDNNVAMVGYCEIGGVPDTGYTDPDDCQAAGGTWITAAPIAESVKTVQIASSDGSLASVQDRMVAYEDDIGGLSTGYTLKLDNDGYVSGYTTYNTGTTASAVWRVDTFAIGVPGGLDAFPFIVDNGVVIMDTAIIGDATITEGQLGAITIGKLEDDLGNPITTIAGLIRADAIDADNLDVNSAATFYGDVQSGNYSAGTLGWKINQTGDVEFNEGTFNGTATFATTAGDTNNVAGSSATVVRDRSTDGYNAKQRTDSWTKSGTTKINGGVIESDTAFVGTLFIEDNAVTVPNAFYYPSFVWGFGSWSTLAVLTISVNQPGTILFSFSGRVGYTAGSEPTEYRLFFNNTEKITGLSNSFQDFPNMAFSADVNAGTHTCAVEWKAPDTVRIGYISGIAMGVKK